MSKKKEMKKEIERLKDENSSLRENLSYLRRGDMFKREEIEKLNAMLQKANEDSGQRYAELLEKYITMMERTIRLNEQREAD